MLQADKLNQFALILKPYGSMGEIVVSLSPNVSSELDLSEPVFIFYDKLPVPFFIESFTKRGKNRALVRLSGIETIDDAQEICGRDLYLEGDQEEIDDQPDLIGFVVKDQNSTTIGPILEIVDFSGNICISVKKESDNIYIPLHEDLILEIDRKKKVIILELPQGLF